MKIGAKTIKFFQYYWRQSPTEVRRRLERGGYQAYREKRSKMLAITKGKEKLLTREAIQKYKVSAEPQLMRCSYDLDIGSATRESPQLIFEFQFFVTASRPDAESWADGKYNKNISERAASIFTDIMQRNELSGDMQKWLYGMIKVSDRRYAEAERKDKNFIRVSEDRGTGKRVKYAYY